MKSILCFSIIYIAFAYFASCSSKTSERSPLPAPVNNRDSLAENGNGNDSQRIPNSGSADDRRRTNTGKDTDKTVALKFNSNPVTLYSFGAQITDPRPFDLSKFSMIDYDEVRGSHDRPHWVIKKKTGSQEAFVQQETNAWPSHFVSAPRPEAELGYGRRIRGTISVQTPLDNDVFAPVLIDPSNKYNFFMVHWERGSHTEMTGGVTAYSHSGTGPVDDTAFFGELSHADNTIHHTDPAGSDANDPLRWYPFRKYLFTLYIYPDSIRYEIHDGSTEVSSATISIPNNPHHRHRLGLFNASQKLVRYESFSDVALMGLDYMYLPEVNANVEELRFELEKGPEGMIIDKNNGLITWPADKKMAGTYEIAIKAIHKDGRASTQKFELFVP